MIVFLWSLVEANHSQTIPYVSFMGDTLPNHAYVDLTTVGNNISPSGDTVRCHTDLTTCCTGGQGVHRGDWYFSYGAALDNINGVDDINRSRGAQVVHLRRRNNAISPFGIYRCDIETNAVNDNDVDTITGETVYVGLYPPNKGMRYAYIIFSAEYIYNSYNYIQVCMKTYCRICSFYWSYKINIIIIS